MFTSVLRPAILARCLPMLAFMAGLAWRGAQASSDGTHAWLYAWQVGAAALLLLVFWRQYGELARQQWPTWREAVEACAVGLVVFGFWVGLDQPWMQLGEAAATFVPWVANGSPQGQIDWALVGLRVAGAVLVVPIMEELFWRSFLMRWVDDAMFERVHPAAVSAKALVLSSFVFVLAHTQWLAAALAGLAYALLYRRSGKLWVAIGAHAVTNAALAAWVVHQRQWQWW